LTDTNSTDQPPPASEEPSMEIHKPKPVHSWRELLTEICVVVIGVLIALSAEQVVVGLREARLAREARVAIREELVGDLSDEQARSASRPCTDRRLNEIGDYLAGVGRGEKNAPPSWIGRPSLSRPYSGQWQAATQSGRVSLLPKAEAAGYAEMYYMLQRLEEAQREEQNHWAELRTLQRLPALSPEMVKQFQVALSAARYSNWYMKLDSLRLHEIGLTQDLKPDAGFKRPGELPKVASVCIPIKTPPTEALAMFGTSYGDPN
jgi:hypothetical protein